MQKHIVSQTPGCVVYKGPKEGEFLYSFTDTYVCPVTKQSQIIPGRGALAHRISAYFFSKLRHVQIPSHFVRTLNMRESLMYSAYPLPFEILVTCAPTEDFMRRFGLPADFSLERPLIEYRHTESGEWLGESHIFAFQWITPEGWEELQILTMRCIDFLRGLMIGVGLDLIKLRLQFGHSFLEDGEEVFFLIGELSPETFCVVDLETGQRLGHPYLLTTQDQPIFHYRRIAKKLGLPMGSVLSFAKSPS